MKITYEHLSSENFTRSFQKLTNLPVGAHTAYNIKRMADALTIARKQISAEYQALHAKIMGDAKEPTEEQQKALLEMQENFGKQTVDIARFPLNIEDFKDAKGLSAVDILALDPILLDMDSLSQGAEVLNFPK
jgi:hypothetical protein